MKKNKDNNKTKPSLKSWYFLIFTLLIFVLVSFIAPEKANPIINSFAQLLGRILPIFVVVYLVIVLSNFYINNKKLKKYMGEEAGIKAWIIVVIAGIISMGSIYAWYPLLQDLKERGVKDKFLVTFLYNRGIKLQWLPILLLYFGWVYSLTLLIVMAVISVFQGIIVERLVDASKNTN